jgi:two-component sensor histidine kinase
MSPTAGAAATDGEALGAVIRRLSRSRSIDDVTDVITHAARAALGADGATFVLRDGDLCRYVGEDAVGPLLKGRSFPLSACVPGWCMLHDEAVSIPDIDADPRRAQDAYRPTFVKSLAMAPVGREEPVAALGAYWAEPHEATAGEMQQLRVMANAAALALAFVQQPTSWAATGSSVTAEGVTDALTAGIAVVDASGTIIAVNRPWREFAAANGARHPRAWLGANYLDICAAATGAEAEMAQLASEGIREVLAGRRRDFVLEYPCHGPDAQRWFEMRVTPVRRGEAICAVVAHENVTERRLAEDGLRSQASLLDAIMEYVPEGITVARAPDVTIERISTYGLRRIRRSAAELTAIGAEEHPQAWQVLDREGNRLLGAEELPLTRAVRQGEIVEDEQLTLGLPDGSLLPILCNAGPIRDADGQITGGIIAWRDFTERAKADELRQTVVLEIEHRMRNLFTVINGVVALTARHCTTPAEMAGVLSGRIGALAKAHDLIRPAFHSGVTQGRSFGELVEAVISAHLVTAAQLRLDGPEITIGPTSATALALVFHELATNSDKYGALSKQGGLVDVSWRYGEDEGELQVSWKERGGPAVHSPPAREGFGTGLVRRMVTRQLGGRVDLGWRAEGLQLEVSLPIARLRL